MTIIYLAILQGVVFGIAGMAVRLQYSLFRGFDFMVGGLVLVSAEAFIFATKQFPDHFGVGLVVAWPVSVLCAVSIATAWNASILRIWRGHWHLGAALFVGSLGMNTAITGAVGLIRGPGLVQTPWQLGYQHIAGLPPTTLLGLIICGSALAGLLAFRRTSAGLAIELYGQNPQFAVEIGVDARRIAIATSVKTGIACGVIGGYFSMADGSRTDLGLSLFLYGSAAALLFSIPTLSRAALGGVIIGVIHVVLQLMVSPSISGLFLFSGIAILLLARGSSRLSEGVR